MQKSTSDLNSCSCIILGHTGGLSDIVHDTHVKPSRPAGSVEHTSNLIKQSLFSDPFSDGGKGARPELHMLLQHSILLNEWGGLHQQDEARSLDIITRETVKLADVSVRPLWKGGCNGESPFTHYGS